MRVEHEVDRLFHQNLEHQKQAMIPAKIFVMTTLLFMVGCAGVREGYFSMPYIGSEPRDNVWSWPGICTDSNKEREEGMLRLEGVSIRINMRNNLQTSNTLWFGIEIPMIPVSVDRKETWSYHADKVGYYCMQLTVTPEVEGITFEPRLAVLSVDGKAYPAIKATLESVDPELSQILQLNSGSRFIELCLDTNRPRPEQHIQLDLSRALVIPGGKSVPVIHFQKQLYRQCRG